MRSESLLATIVAGLILAIAGCGQQGPKVADMAIIPVADPATARPVQFHRIVFDIKRGTDIGLLGKGIGYCTQWNRWLYRPGDLSFSGKELTENFRSVLMAANYNVVGDPRRALRRSISLEGRVSRRRRHQEHECGPLLLLRSVGG